jgi:hypothetical protein
MHHHWTIAMPPAVNATVFGILGLIAIWSIRNNIISGTASSRGWTCTVEDNPIGFCLIVCSRAAIAGFAIAEILYAFELCADPLKTLQHALPFLPASPRHTSDLIRSYWA